MSGHLHSASLQSEEIQPFLEFMFQSVVRKADRLPLNQTAGVAMYLATLSKKGIRRGAEYPEGRQLYPDERSARSLALMFAQTVWGTLLQFSDITPCNQTTVLEFMERHRNTYLANQNFDALVSLIENFEIPAWVSERRQPVPLLSPRMQFQADTNPNVEDDPNSNLQDDVSERIFAVYWLLKGVRKRADLIAKSLNKHGIERPRKVADIDGRYDFSMPDPVWDGMAVMDRQRMFERINLKLPRSKSRSPLEKARIEFRFVYTQRWLTYFRYYQLVNSEIEKGVAVDSVS
jgi:hypothetical protein